MRFVSGKTYAHNVGLSCCFRQWRAKSHCRFMHGYALYVSLTFVGLELDENNWLVNFGGLKEVKAKLEDLLDHKTLVALDDPEFAFFEQMADRGLIQLVPVQSTGLESFARLIHGMVDDWLDREGYKPRVGLQKVEVREHEGNFARYEVND
jgi:6-pyruvoyltetrahydropterin/6-carboxytetrahydropterin synthase